MIAVGSDDEIEHALDIGIRVALGARGKDGAHGHVVHGLAVGGPHLPVVVRGEPEDGAFGQGHFYKPTIFDQVTPNMRIAVEEIFGPVLSVITVSSFEEAIQVLNNTPYGLSSSIYTADVNRAMRAIRDIEAGITYINGPTIGAEVQLPFGGVKETGNGHREGGPTVIDAFTEWKSVYIDYSGKLQKAQIDR